MKQDRFLTGILIGIGVLIVAALVVFFLRKYSQTYVADDVPEGVVHHYVVAVLNKDYEKAYGRYPFFSYGDAMLVEPEPAALGDRP